jgi:hypothetical protein
VSESPEELIVDAIRASRGRGVDLGTILERVDAHERVVAVVRGVFRDDARLTGAHVLVFPDGENIDIPAERGTSALVARRGQPSQRSP